MKSGIYVITSPSGGQYVGSAVNLRKRWSTHKSRLRSKNHHSRALQAAWNKYGEDALAFSIMFSCSPDMLLFYEQRAIDVIQPKYNICKVAGSSLGVIRTSETRAKVAAANKGRPMPEITRRRLLEANTGRKLDDEHRRKIGLGNKGKIISAEARAKASLTKSGRSLSESHKEKTLMARVGRPYSIEQLRVASAFWTAQQADAENAKRCRCIETGDVFNSTKIAGMWLRSLGYSKADFRSISAALGGMKKSAYGFRWECA